MESVKPQYCSPRPNISKKRFPIFDLTIVTEEHNSNFDDALELEGLVTPQPRKLVCPSPAGPPPQSFFKFDSVEPKDSKSRQAEDEIMGIFFQNFDSTSTPVEDAVDNEPTKRFFATISPVSRDFTTPVPISTIRSVANNRLASPFSMGTPPGRVANPLPLNSPFVDNTPIGAELGLLSLSPPAKDDILLQHQRVKAVRNRQRSLSLGDNPRAMILGKA